MLKLIALTALVSSLSTTEGAAQEWFSKPKQSLPPTAAGLVQVLWDRGTRAKQESGEAVQSSHQWIFGRGLIGVLAVIVAVGCEQHVDGLGNNPPMTREIAHSGQVDLDVAAIVAGMTRAHGAPEVASLPKWWRDLLSQP